jgi:hypothetical protein
MSARPARFSCGAQIVAALAGWKNRLAFDNMCSHVSGFATRGFTRNPGKSSWPTSASATLKEIAMIGRKAFAALAVIAALGVLGAAPARATDRDDHGIERGGAVVRCSLAGVNPVHHPEVFGNAATAKSYGFVQTADGVWHVLPGCGR